MGKGMKKCVLVHRPLHNIHAGNRDVASTEDALVSSCTPCMAALAQGPTHLEASGT